MEAVSVIRESEHVSSDEIALQNLRASIRGVVILREDPAFHPAWRNRRATISGHPFMIVKCFEIADVLTALEFATDHKMTVSVVGGLHRVAGSAGCDDGLVIDLSPMKGTSEDATGKTIFPEGQAVSEKPEQYNLS